ncbi:MAG: hypothetical protein ACP5O8_02130 [Candidatus Aenigmatarchaeota archaeon]
MKILTEKEIIKDLKYNFPGQRIKIDHLFKPGNPFFAQSKEEAIIGYSCGYFIREFLLKDGLRLSFSSRELFPIVFNVYGAKELYEICEGGKGPKGLEDLKKLGIVDFELFSGGSITGIRRVAFYVNDFETMKKLLKCYAYKTNANYKKFEERFEENLGSLKPYVNKISERSLEVYRSAKEWYKTHLSLKDFKFTPKTLTFDLRIESLLVV